MYGRKRIVNEKKELEKQLENLKDSEKEYLKKTDAHTDSLIKQIEDLENHNKEINGHLKCCYQDIKDLQKEIIRLQEFHKEDMRVTNKSADFHIKECAKLRDEINKLKEINARHVIHHIESICDKCGHIKAEDGCLFCFKEQFKQLEKDSKILGALYEAGVDNWEGYNVALSSLKK
jgi:seryl-tRNA synthetase